MCRGIKRNVVICEKGKKGRKITKRLRGPVSRRRLLLALDEKHKRYPRGSPMQQAGILWHLNGWRNESGRTGRVAKLQNYSMNKISWQIMTLPKSLNYTKRLTKWPQCFLMLVLTFYKPTTVSALQLPPQTSHIAVYILFWAHSYM